MSEGKRLSFFNIYIYLDTFLALKTSLSCFSMSLQVLINRLEQNRGMKPEERANIMKTLKELTEKIAQLQNEMNPSPASQVSSAKPNQNQSKTKTDVSRDPFSQVHVFMVPFVGLVCCFSVLGEENLSLCEQAQKELLDAELDFHKKMSSGEDTTDLKRKLGQLQVEVIQHQPARIPNRPLKTVIDHQHVSVAPQNQPTDSVMMKSIDVCVCLPGLHEFASSDLAHLSSRLQTSSA